MFLVLIILRNVPWDPGSMFFASLILFNSMPANVCIERNHKTKFWRGLLNLSINSYFVYAMNLCSSQAVCFDRLIIEFVCISIFLTGWTSPFAWQVNIFSHVWWGNHECYIVTSWFEMIFFHCLLCWLVITFLHPNAE